jgi:hypothetical protein
MGKIRYNGGGRKGSASLNGVSKGEREVMRTLRKLDVRFFRETVFDGCRSKVSNKLLPFDISVYVGDELEALIEFQGVQHFLPSFTVEEWEHTRANDETKREFCEKEGIPLLAIPYHKFNKIEEIVTEFLRQRGILNKNKRYKLSETEQEVR